MRAKEQIHAAIRSACPRLLYTFMLGACPMAALAQTAPAAAQPDASTPTTTTLQEVVVTAQFRSESVQQTPLAITAISAADLQDKGQTSIQQITNDVPSVNLMPNAGQFGPSMSAFIRGVGQFDLDPALEPGVGIYIDNVYFGTLTGSMLDLLDLDRVEVLRGPQGTLEGMNSEGGAIKLFSKAPDGTNGGSVDALYGSRNHVQLRANANFVVVPDHLFVRISGVGNQQDGYENVYDFACANPSFTATDTAGVTGTYSVAEGFIPRAGSCKIGEEGGQSSVGGRLALRWIVNDNLEATLIGDLTNQNNQGPAETLLYAGPGPTGASIGVENLTLPTTSGAQLPYDSTKVPAMIPKNMYASYASFCLPAVNNPYVPVIPGLFGGAIDTPASCAQDRQRLQSWGVSSTVNWTLNSEMSLHNIVAERAYSSSWGADVGVSPWPVGISSEGIEHHQFSDELRFDARVGKLLDLSVGGFFFREESVYGTHEDLWYGTDTLNEAFGLPAGFFNGSFNFVSNDPVSAHNRAGYLHTVWHLTSKLDLTLAARYTKQDKTYHYVRLDPDGQEGGTASLVSALNGLSAGYSAHKIDYRGVLDYHWTEDLMTYAQVSTGFKGGGINPRPFYAVQAIPFQPETLTTYEAGLKSEWWDHHIRFNLDGYFSQYRDVQLSLLDCSFIPSIGTLYGTPCVLPYNAGNAHEKGVEMETALRFGGFQLDGSLSYLNFRYVSLNANSGVTLGMITPFTPERQGNLGVQYTQPLASVGSLTARVDVNARSHVYTQAVNAATNNLPGYTTYNARLSWEASQGRWGVAIQALNLTGKRYFLNTLDFTSQGGGAIEGAPAPPMELDLQIQHKF